MDELMNMEVNLSSECWEKVKKWFQQDSQKKILENIATGSTLLHVAVQSSDLEIIDILIKSGVDVNRSNDLGESPLHMAVAPGRSDRSYPWIFGEKPAGYYETKVLELLLAHDADVNAGNIYKTTQFHMILVLGKTEKVLLFLKHGADIFTRDEIGQSAMHYAAIGGSVDTLKLVLNSGGDVNDKEVRKITALEIVSEKHNVECVELLLSRGADVNIIDVCGSTAFDSLTMYENCRKPRYDSKKTKELMRLFIDRSANVGFDCSPKCLFKFERKIILQEITKFKELDLPVDEVRFLQPLLKDSEWNRSYFNKCTRELSTAKICRIYDDTWVTFWHLITGSLDDLRKYAENDDLMRAFEKSDYKKKFPNYAELIQRNVRRGIETRKFLHAAEITISQRFPIQLPTLVLKKIICYSGAEYLTWKVVN